MALEKIETFWENSLGYAAQEKNEKLLPTIVAFFSLAFIFFLLLIRDVPVRNVMEARNFKAAEEIVESGNWLIPTLNGEPRIRKPPLPTWFVALMGRVAGTRNLFWLRLPNVLMALFLLFALFLLVKDIYGDRAATFALMIGATCGKFAGEIQIARWDMFVCAFAFSGLWCSWRLATRKKMGYFVLACLSWGAAYLSKGPVGFAVVLAPFLLAFVCFQGMKRDGEGSSLPTVSSVSPKSWKLWAGLSLLLIVSSGIGNGWFFMVRMQYPETWQVLYSDVINVNVSRAEPFHYYLYRAPILLSPWVLLFVAACVAGLLDMYARSRKWMKRKTDRLSSTGWPIDDKVLFAFLWFAFGLLLLSLMPAKKNRYFFVLIPSASVLMGVFLDQMTRSPILSERTFLKWASRIHRNLLSFGVVSMPLLFLLFLFLKAAWEIGVPHLISCLPLMREIPLDFSPLLRGAPWLLVLPVLGIGAKLWHKTRLDIPRMVCETTIASMVAMSVFFLCVAATPWDTSGYESAYPVKQITQGHPLFLLHDDNDEEMHEMLWGIGRNWEIARDLSRIPSGFVLMEEIDRTGIQGELERRSARLRYRFYVMKTRLKEKWHLYELEKK